MMRNVSGLQLLGVSLLAMAAAGCSDADPLPTKYVTMTQQVSAVGTTNADCLFIKVGAPQSAVTVRPADGTCDVKTDFPGQVCGRDSDCGLDGICQNTFVCDEDDPLADTPCNPAQMSGSTENPCGLGNCTATGPRVCMGPAFNPGAPCQTNDDCPPNPECLNDLNDETFQNQEIIAMASIVANVQIQSPACGFCGGQPSSPCRTVLDCPPNQCNIDGLFCGLTGDDCFYSCADSSPFPNTPGMVCAKNAGGTPCPPTCVGGPNEGNNCTFDFECSGGACVEHCSVDSCAQDFECVPGGTVGSFPAVALAAGRYKVETLPLGYLYIDFGDPTDPNDTVQFNCGGGLTVGAQDVIPGFSEPQTFELGPGKANVLNYVIHADELQAVIDSTPNPCATPGFVGVEDILEIRAD